MSRLQTNAIRHLGSVVDNLTLDNAGRVLTPNQPAFFAGGSAGAVAANHTYKPASNAVSLNTGGHFNASTGLFTAPVAGLYMFSWVLLMQGVTTNAQVDPQYVINGSGYYYGPRAVAASPNTFGDGFLCVSGSVVRKLETGDAFSVRSNVSTGTFNFYNDPYWTQFMGCLIG